MAGKFSYGAGADMAVGEQAAPGTVEIPLQVDSGFQGGAQVVDGLEPFRVKDADGGERFGVLGQAVFKLFLEEAAGRFPLTFQDDGIAGFQFDSDIRGAKAAAPFGPGGDAVSAQHFGQQGIDRFLADGFGGRPLGMRLHHHFPGTGLGFQYSKEQGVMPVAKVIKGIRIRRCKFAWPKG